ncbi:polysaccharide biosynthesis protein HfsG [soil metagenome]
MSEPNLTRSPNPRWNAAIPTLSVLIPFHGHDPAPLLRMLDREAATLAGRVEIVLLDDGNPTLEFSEAAEVAAAASPLPVMLLTLRPNEGRSKGRNRLAAAARGPWFLFLDSDMAPDAPDFLARWLALIDADAPACAVGGFSLEQATPAPEHRLHAALQARAECAPVGVRSADPAKYVYTSNLLVRRDVFTAEAFDEGFTGWGWEDVEWGMRVAARFGVTHVDNPASHLGLDTADQLAWKYAQSAANFARVLARHPQVVKAYPSYRVARVLSLVPGHRLLAAAFRGLALREAAPLPLRIAAMKLHRAALYAQVL